MSDVLPREVGHENAVTGGELVTASTALQFYDFADRCMDWARTTPSLQERALYTQLGMQWLAAGARLQTLLHLNCGEAKTVRTKDADI